MTTYKAFAVAATLALATIGGTAHAQFAKNGTTIMTPETMGTIKQAPVGTPLTREQVVAEREQARQAGTLAADYVTGKPVFAAKTAETVVAGKTRAEVRAEVAQANREGTLVVSDITGKPYYGVNKRAAERHAGAE